jgi:hypothetical protein
VNAKDARDVARHLGLTAAQGGKLEGGRKFPCRWCASSDALHAYPTGGVHCFACGRHASNADLAADVLGTAPVEALRTLAGRLGVYVPDPAPVRAAAGRVGGRTGAPTGAGGRSVGRGGERGRTGVVANAAAPLRARVGATTNRIEPQKAPDPDGFAALREGGVVPTLPATLYAGLLEVLTLADVGANALEARGFDPATAAADGFRAVPDAAGWRALRDYLGDSFDPAERAAAGLHKAPWRNEPWFGAWSAQPPALVIPYRYRGAVVALRFRHLAPDAPHGARYRTLAGVTIPQPFNADALDAAAGGELHVVEGELNAYALARHGAHAVGLAGAGTWRPEWAAAVARAGRLVAWYDPDNAGRKGRAKLSATLAEALGAPWLAAHGRACTLPADTGDVNDWHRAGQLAALLAHAPWRGTP